MVDIPLLFMGYFNQMLRFGVEKFLKTCVNNGIDGLIVPDMPPEIYKQKYLAIFEKYNLSMSFLVTPTTSDDRIKMIDKLSSGFVYVVSSSSTTGKIDTFSQEQIDYFQRIKKLNLVNPTIVGFGISNRERFLLANKYTNGAIIGSAFIKAIKDKENYLEQTKSFISKILNK
jgi:tryptophan synthase alpha chain